MSLVDALLPEFDREMMTTRRLLERIPEDRLGWQPHARSTTLGDLAAHLVSLANWGAMVMEHPDLDLGGATASSTMASRAALLATFDTNAAATRAALASRIDAELMQPWALKSDGRTIFTMPKAAVWRSFVMNHLIHHRGQLCVYLRMLDVRLPSIYGPSADEGAF